VPNIEHPEHHQNHDPGQNTDHHRSDYQQRHQILTIDEFSAVRVHRLWDDWLSSHPPGGGAKHEFYRTIVSKTQGLDHVRLAAVYVMLARLDAQQASTLFPSAKQVPSERG